MQEKDPLISDENTLSQLEGKWIGENIPWGQIPSALFATIARAVETDQIPVTIDYASKRIRAEELARVSVNALLSSGNIGLRKIESLRKALLGLVAAAENREVLVQESLMGDPDLVRGMKVLPKVALSWMRERLSAQLFTIFASKGFVENDGQMSFIPAEKLAQLKVSEVMELLRQNIPPVKSSNRNSFPSRQKSAEEWVKDSVIEVQEVLDSLSKYTRVGGSIRGKKQASRKSPDQP
jgi:hypothetical protein